MHGPIWVVFAGNMRSVYIIIIIIFTSLRERDEREKSEEKIDCHHQDSNQGPSLVANDALTINVIIIIITWSILKRR